MTPHPTPAYRWPPQGAARVPYWVYIDEAIYRREQERIFCGPSWAYVALAAELPNPGDFRRSVIGDKPVVVVRDLDGRVQAFENRCTHRGVQFCQKRSGNAREFMCPYHQWTFDLPRSSPLRAAKNARHRRHRGCWTFCRRPAP